MSNVNFDNFKEFADGVFKQLYTYSASSLTLLAKMDREEKKELLSIIKQLKDMMNNFKKYVVEDLESR